MEDVVILVVILTPFVFRFIARVKDAYVEAEQERLRTSGKGRGPRGERRVHDERYYARVLGLQGINGPDDVKQAYRRLAPQYHPDRVSHLGPKLREVAEQEMKDINEAYAYFKRKYGD